MSTLFGRLLRTGPALLAVSAAGIFPAQPAGAAVVEGLRYESHTSYTVDPGAAAVHVVFDATITNQQPDRPTPDGVLHYFFPNSAIPVLAEATNFAATRDDGQALTVRREAEGDDQFAVAVVDLVPDLDYGQTTHFRLTYDLPHLAPRSAGFTRINAAFATFAAFGYGDPGLTSFEIRVPDGFKVEFTGAELKKDDVDGMQRLTSGPLDDPDNTFAVVAARHDDGLLTRPLELDAHKIVIRAWPDDPEWGTFVERELTNGIPAMESLVGLPWPHPDDELSIVEAASPYIYGYAGWFLPETNSIEVGDDLDPRVILHELSHLWFNNRLFVERWISEAFAETYAAHTLGAIGESVPAPDPVRADSPAAMALATWDDPTFTEENTDEREAYGYNTSFFVVNSVAGEIGMDAMRKVVAATEKRSIAYQGDQKPEGVVTRVDSRRLLDLMQQLGGSTAAPALFGQYVLRPEDAARLPARAAARDQYAALVAAGAGWSPPYPVRDAMSDWDFGAATTRIQAAIAILATRDGLAAKAKALDLAVPRAFERAYETGKTLPEIAETGTALVGATRAIATAQAAVDHDQNVIERIGALGSGGDDALHDARQDFAAGDAEGAVASAHRAVADVAGAGAAGAQRVGIAVGVLVLAGAAVFLVRRRRRAPADMPALAPETKAAAPAEEPWTPTP